MAPLSPSLAGATVSPSLAGATGSKEKRRWGVHLYNKVIMREDTSVMK